MAITNTLVINDLHIPYHDEKLVNLILDAAKDLTVDRIVINGDLLDFYNLSRYEKDPYVEQSLEDELIAGREWIQDLRKKFPKQEIIFIFGNHENRLNSYIATNAKAFTNILLIEKMLLLENLDIKWITYNNWYQLEKTNLYIQHSPPSYGVNGARTSLLKKNDANFIWGCAHRKQVACITGFSGEVYTAYFNGWLGSTSLSDDHKRVFSYAKGHETWQQTACFVTVVDETEFFVQQLDIKNYKFAFNGFLYEA